MRLLGYPQTGGGLGPGYGPQCADPCLMLPVNVEPDFKLMLGRVPRRVLPSHKWSFQETRFSCAFIIGTVPV